MRCMAEPRASRDRAPLRVAIVGAGLMGRMHARAVAGAGGVVVAVADVDLDRARAIDGSVAAFASIGQLLDSTSPDVVHVCTPVGSHAETAGAALAAGAHVVIEKPVAQDAETTRRLIDRATEAGRLLVPVHQFLFQPGVMRLLARQQELGRLVRCSFVAATAGSEKTGMDPDALVSEILPHPLSLFARVSPASLGELAWHAARPARGELRALAVAGHLSLEIAITSNGRPTRTELELIGTRATGLADLFHGFAIIERGSTTRIDKVARPFARSFKTVGASTANLARRSARRESAYPGLRELVRRTYDALEAGGAPPIDLDETLAVAHARDRILER
jgi:predicted dehydrogenase